MMNRERRAECVRASDIHHSAFVIQHSARALTLIEILVVVGIIGILVTVIGLVGMSVREKGKREYTRGVMNTLMIAMEEFRSAPKPASIYWQTGWPNPPNNPQKTDINQPSLGLSPYEPCVDPVPAPENDYYPVGPSGNFEKPPNVVLTPQDAVLSIEGLWTYLSVIPTAKAVLDRLPETAKRNARSSLLRIRPMGCSQYEFVDPMQVLDAWGRPLRYRWYIYRNNNRPYLWSAGPDGFFALDSNRIGDPVRDPNGHGADDIFSDRKD